MGAFWVKVEILNTPRISLQVKENRLSMAALACLSNNGNQHCRFKSFLGLFHVILKQNGKNGSKQMCMAYNVISCKKLEETLKKSKLPILQCKFGSRAQK